MSVETQGRKVRATRGRKPQVQLAETSEVTQMNLSVWQVKKLRLREVS